MRGPSQPWAPLGEIQCPRARELRPQVLDLVEETRALPWGSEDTVTKALRTGFSEVGPRLILSLVQVSGYRRQALSEGRPP